MQEIKIKYPVVVSFTAGATLNMGNYQSVRVTVGLSVPVYNAKNVDAVYEKIVRKVESLLQKKVEEYTKDTAYKVDEILVDEL